MRKSMRNREGFCTPVKVVEAEFLCQDFMQVDGAPSKRSLALGEAGRLDPPHFPTTPFCSMSLQFLNCSTLGLPQFSAPTPQLKRSSICRSPGCLSSPSCHIVWPWAGSFAPGSLVPSLCWQNEEEPPSSQGHWKASLLMPVNVVHAPGIPTAAGLCPRDSCSSAAGPLQGILVGRRQHSRSFAFYYISVL